MIRSYRSRHAWPCICRRVGVGGAAQLWRRRREERGFPGQVEPSFDSSEVTSVELVANDLLRAHGKDAVIMIINRLREASALNITLTELQNIGGEDLVNALVQIATEFGVEPPELSEMIAQVIRNEAFESRAREPPAEPSRAEEGYIESTKPR